MVKIEEKNVKDYRIRDTLNRGGGKTDNEFGTKFRRLANINKWSKRKPTIYNKLFEKGDEEPAIWQAYNGLCGFSEESILFVDKYSLVSAFNNNRTYVYELPTGGSGSPYRMGDFRGYSPDAKSPVWSFDYTGQIYANDTSSSSTFKVMGNSSVDSETNLTMSDILPDAVTSLSDWFFCVIVADMSGNVLATTKSDRLGNNTEFVKEASVSHSQLSTMGSYRAYPSFCDAEEKHFVACPIGFVEFQVLDSPDASKLGWMQGTGFWSSGDRFTYTGQLGYTEDFEGLSVFIELQVNGQNYGNGQEVVLSKDSSSADGKINYMTYTRTIRMAVVGGDTYRLRCGYGANWANNAYLDLIETNEPIEWTE